MTDPILLKPAIKKESGAAGRRRRRLEEEAEQDRQRERLGLEAELKHRLDEIGPPPENALQRQAWAGRVAGALAWAALHDLSLPLVPRMKLAAEFLDRVSAAHSKAFVADEISELRRRAGLDGRPPTDPTRTVQIPRGGALRAEARHSTRLPVPAPPDGAQPPPATPPDERK